MALGMFRTMNKKIDTGDGKGPQTAAQRAVSSAKEKKANSDKNKDRAAGNIAGELGIHKDVVKQDSAAAAKQQGMAQAMLNAQTPTKLLKGPIHEKIRQISS